MKDHNDKFDMIVEEKDLEGELLTAEEFEYIQKEEAAKKTTNICKQYSYVSQDEVNTLILTDDLYENMLNGKVWLPVKAGQTFRDVLERIKEQYKTSNRFPLVPLDTSVVSESDDLKLDDKIRDVLETDDEFVDFVASHDVIHINGKEKKHEWIYVNIYDVLVDSGIIGSKTELKNNFENVKEKLSIILENHIALDLLSEKLGEAKRTALHKMGQKSSFHFTLNQWQEDVIDIIINDGNKYYVLLSLAPRLLKSNSVASILYPNPL